MLATAGCSQIGITVGGESSPAPTPARPSTQASATAPASSRPSPAVSATTSAGTTAAACVSDTYDSLSREQRRGQLVMVALDVNAGAESLDPLLTSRHAGGVVLLGGWGDPTSVSQAVGHLSELAPRYAAGVDLLIAADQEGGQVQQLRGGSLTRLPSALTQGQLSTDQLRQDAAGWGRELADLGVNVNLAPVADTVPEQIGRGNGPIGRWDRQYGSDPGAVGEHVAAFVDGMSQAGVATVVKHFPGLGRVTNNTDFSATGITDDVMTTDDPFLAPFVDGIDAGAGMVMVSSASYPLIDRQNLAVFSSAILTDLLRGQLGYDGVVISDDLNAEALQSTEPADRAVDYLRAGGDIALTGNPQDVGPMLDAITAAGNGEPGFADRVERSVRRVLTLKESLGLLPCSTSAESS